MRSIFQIDAIRRHRLTSTTRRLQLLHSNAYKSSRRLGNRHISWTRTTALFYYGQPERHETMAPDDSISHSLAKALSLEPDSVKLDAHGGSSFSSTFKLTGTKNGKTVKYFLKLGRGEEAKIMFRGEHASLNAIHAAVPFFSPASHAHGELSPSQFFLATDFIDMSPSSRVQPGTGLSFAAKLAKLHTTPAPIPEGYSEPMFGFLHPTCCGATVQENDWEATWPVFFAKHRIGTMRARAEKRGMRPEKSKVLEQLEKKVVPRLLGAVKDVQPVVVHGDLWSGNHSRAAVKKDGRDGDEDMVMEEMVFDPSCVYGHSEYELGIMHMFGGFGSSFWKEYESLVPKAEPVDEWADRIELYEMYHHLNHYVLFGGSYEGSALRIAKKLVSKYAQPE